MFIAFAILITTFSCSIQEGDDYKKKRTDITNFTFSYIDAGLGSNLGKKLPKFRITGNKFLYTIERNSSFSGENDKVVDTICQGQIRISSIDSILMITNQIEDTLIYETTLGISSGSIRYINIVNGNKKINFELHNASHPLADKIIEIVNTNIPKQYNELTMWKHWEERKELIDRGIIEIKIPDSLSFGGYPWKE